MRILFITHRLPCPPDRGCKVRSAALLHGLVQRHDVWCAGFLDSGDTPEFHAEVQRSVTSLRHLCRGFQAVPFRPRLAGYRALAGLVGGGTATEGYFRSRTLSATIARWSRDVRFDAVFAFSSGMAPLALEAVAPRRVLCMDDLDSRKWHDLADQARPPMNLLYRMEGRRLARREHDWLEAFEATLVVSPREADLVTDPRLRRKVHVIPPILPGLGATATSPLSPVGAEPVVGFLGAMDYAPNIDAACWFAREIWPQVRRRSVDARLLLVGRSPVPAVRELSRLDGVTVTGTVAQVEPYLAAMRVHVAPLRISRGVQIKVLTAMAAGRPCVATSSVADGLGARAGRDLLVADTPAAFAEAILDLLHDDRKATALGLAGQQFVEQFNPGQVMARVEGLLRGEAETPPGRSCRAAADRPAAKGRMCEEAVLAGSASTGGSW